MKDTEENSHSIYAETDPFKKTYKGLRKGWNSTIFLNQKFFIPSTLTGALSLASQTRCNCHCERAGYHNGGGWGATAGYTATAIVGGWACCCCNLLALPCLPPLARAHSCPVIYFPSSVTHMIKGSCVLKNPEILIKIVCDHVLRTTS